jgi:hypothetical protein
LGGLWANDQKGHGAEIAIPEGTTYRSEHVVQAVDHAVIIQAVWPPWVCQRMKNGYAENRNVHQMEYPLVKELIIYFKPCPMNSFWASVTGANVYEFWSRGYRKNLGKKFLDLPFKSHVTNHNLPRTTLQAVIKGVCKRMLILDSRLTDVRQLKEMMLRLTPLAPSRAVNHPLTITLGNICCSAG